jgi:hypothetical protein
MRKLDSNRSSYDLQAFFASIEAEAIPEFATLTPVIRSSCGAFRDCEWHTYFFGVAWARTTARFQMSIDLRKSWKILVNK